jgi:catalase
LSLTARPGNGSVAARRIALLVADDCDDAPLGNLVDALIAAGAVPRFLASSLGAVNLASGERQADTSVEAMPSVLWDAVVIPGGEGAAALAADGRVLEFIKDQYRHCKPMLVIGDGRTVLERAGIPAALPSGEADPGLIIADNQDARLPERFIAALARHRHFERETDPPRV